MSTRASDLDIIGLSHRFQLTLDDGKIDLGFWSKVEGLEVSWDVCEYRAGDQGNVRWYVPGLTHYRDVTLSRAASKKSADVKEFLGKNSFQHKPNIGGKITLLNDKNETVIDWDLYNVVPIKWSISGFDANRSGVAVETLTLAHLGFLDGLE